MILLQQFAFFKKIILIWVVLLFLCLPPICFLCCVVDGFCLHIIPCACPNWRTSEFFRLLSAISNFSLSAFSRTLVQNLQVNHFCGTGKQKDSFNLHMREILTILQLFNEINILILYFFQAPSLFSPFLMLLVLEPVNLYHLDAGVAVSTLVVASCNSRWDNWDFI